MSSPEDKKGQAPSNRGALIIGLSLAAAVIVLVVAVFFLLKTTNVVQPVAFKVGDREVTESQLATYVEAGKKSGASEATVRQIVIEHEKNVQLAEKYHIAMPDAFIAQNNGSVVREQNSDGNVYIELVRYNQTFTARLAQQALAGYGVIVYEIPVQAVAGSEEQNLTQAKAIANQFRSQITEQKQEPAKVLDRVSQYTADQGLAAKSGIRFIPSEIIYDDSATGSVASDAYVLAQIKGKGTGVTEVKESGSRSVFFVDVLFEQKKRTEIASDVQRDKESMKVVEYDV